jgi:hypothetical protein
MDDITEKKFKRLRSLKQYKDKSDEEIFAIIEKKNNRLAPSENKNYISKEEEIFAKETYDKYLKEVQIETSSDKSDLDTLVYLEVLSQRIKKFISDQYIDTKAIDMRMSKELIEVNTEIREMKTALGLNKKADSGQSGDQVIESLKKRFHNWINQADNRASYTASCPECKKKFLIRRRIDRDNEKEIKNPWFIYGGILFNKGVWRCFDEGKINDKDVAEILNCSEKDYRDWIYKHYKEEVKNAKTTD